MNNVFLATDSNLAELVASLFSAAGFEKYNSYSGNGFILHGRRISFGLEVRVSRRITKLHLKNIYSNKWISSFFKFSDSNTKLVIDVDGIKARVEEVHAKNKQRKEDKKLLTFKYQMVQPYIESAIDECENIKIKTVTNNAGKQFVIDLEIAPLVKAELPKECYLPISDEYYEANPYDEMFISIPAFHTILALDSFTKTYNELNESDDFDQMPFKVQAGRLGTYSGPLINCLEFLKIIDKSIGVSEIPGITSYSNDLKECIEKMEQVRVQRKTVSSNIALQYKNLEKNTRKLLYEFKKNNSSDTPEAE